MRIGIFTDTYKPDANGCAQSVEVLTNNLIKLGHVVFVFCPGTNLIIEREDNIIKIPAIEAKKLYGYKIAQPIHPALLKEVADLHLDIIHAETEFGVGTLANLISFNLNIPRVRTYHTDYVDYTHYFVSEDLGPIYDGAKRIVTLYNKFYGDHCLRLMTPSNKTKKGLINSNVKTEITVVPNGIELSRFNKENTTLKQINNIRKQFNISDDEKLFLYVGRIADEKRVDLLINTFSRVKDNKLNAKLLIVGLGTALEKNKKLVNDLGLNDYVFFTGKVEPSDVPMYYHSSDCFVSASTSETQGLTYIEALASSLPIIVAKDEVLDDLLVEGENGYFFTDDDSFYNRIIEFISLDNEKIKQMHLAAVNSTKPYDAREFAVKTANIYSEVIEEFKNSYSIIKTRLNNDVVKLTIKNKLNEEIKLTLSIDDYYAYGFRKDSLLTSRTVEKIKNKENVVLAYQNALKKLSIKDYSVKQMQDSLKNKYELNNDELKCVISKLKEINLLNDESYTLTRINLLKDSLMSKRAIFNKLIKEGISKELIEQLYKDEDGDDINKARIKALKYQSAIKGKSLLRKKQTILNKLLSDGFDINDAKQVVNELEFSKEVLIESDLLKIEAEKAYNKYRKKYDGYELRNHIFNYLASKGFNLESIYAVINEMEY